jgi:putative transposase
VDAARMTAIDLNGVPTSVTIDKSGVTTADMHGLIAHSDASIELRQSKYLTKIVERDHRGTKRRTRPMIGFKSSNSADRIIASIETMHMLNRGTAPRPR